MPTTVLCVVLDQAMGAPVKARAGVGSVALSHTNFERLGGLAVDSPMREGFGQDFGPGSGCGSGSRSGSVSGQGHVGTRGQAEEELGSLDTTTMGDRVEFLIRVMKKKS